MKKIYILLFIALLFQSCMTYYRTSSNFSSLRKGMTKEEVKKVYAVGEKKGMSIVKGSLPNNIMNVKYGNGYAERWTFIIYDCTSYPYLSFCPEAYVEMLFFVNDILVDTDVFDGRGK